MKTKNTITIILLILIGSAALYFLVPAYARHREARADLAEIREALQAQKLEVDRLRNELHSLRTDYRAIERVAREKFHLCREDEEIYRFEKPVRRPAAPAAQ